MKKTLEALTTKKTKKIWMRNRRDRQKRTFEKVRSDSYFFQNFEIQLVERNRTGIENNMKLGSIGPEESEQLETFKRKSSFSPSHFDRSKNRLDWSSFKET